MVNIQGALYSSQSSLGLALYVTNKLLSGVETINRDCLPQWLQNYPFPPPMKLQETVKDREAWCAAVQRVTKSWTWGLETEQQQSSMNESPIVPHPHQHLVVSLFCILAILTGMQWYLTAVSICSSLRTSTVEHLFIYSFSIYNLLKLGVHTVFH